MSARNNKLIWIDLEMTGLNPDTDRIIEIATVVTDPHLNIIAEGSVVAIYQPKAIIEAMDDWNTKQHTGSGLVERIEQSTVLESEAEERTLQFLEAHLNPNKSPMCGNSICQDRRFLYRWMPKLEKFFHYRNLDVSTIKELAKRWAPDLAKGFKKNSKHLALEDVRDSIEELKYYRDVFFELNDRTSPDENAHEQ